MEEVLIDVVTELVDSFNAIIGVTWVVLDIRASSSILITMKVATSQVLCLQDTFPLRI